MGPVDPEQLLEPTITALIRWKARQLRRRPSLAGDEPADLEHELLVTCLQRAHHYDPARGRWFSFLCKVAERAAANLIRRRETASRQGRRTVSLEQPAPDVGGRPISTRRAELRDDAHANRLGSQHRTATEQTALQLDVAQLLAELPSELRVLAERLRHASLTEVAAELGIPRSTLQKRLQHLRAYAERRHLQEYLHPAPSTGHASG